MAVLGYWLVRGLATTAARAAVVARRSTRVVASALAAVVAVAAALPDRDPGGALPRRWTRLLERPPYAANALPGIVIALALVFFAARYAPPSTRRSPCS